MLLNDIDGSKAFQESSFVDCSLYMNTGILDTSQKSKNVHRSDLCQTIMSNILYLRIANYILLVFAFSSASASSV